MTPETLGSSQSRDREDPLGGHILISPGLTWVTIAPITEVTPRDGGGQRDKETTRCQAKAQASSRRVRVLVLCLGETFEASAFFPD